MKTIYSLAGILLLTFGCNYQEVPQTHKGRVFEKGIVSETRGFIGNVLPPGTHDLGYNNELYIVQCAEATVKETLQSPSKNGVIFGIDVYIRYAAECSPPAVQWLLDNVRPEKDNIVTSSQLFTTYMRAALGMAVRDAISSYQSDEINLKRKEIGTQVDSMFRKRVDEISASAKSPRPVRIVQVDLSGITFPDAMKSTMEQLANVKTEVELEKERQKKVGEQIKTVQSEKALAQASAEKTTTEIEEIGKMIHNNPAYLEYLRVQQMPQVFEALGKGGGTVVLGESGLTMVLGKGAVK